MRRHIYGLTLQVCFARIDLLVLLFIADVFVSYWRGARRSGDMRIGRPSVFGPKGGYFDRPTKTLDTCSQPE